jgi:hypothetical protein
MFGFNDNLFNGGYKGEKCLLAVQVGVDVLVVILLLLVPEDLFKTQGNN